MGRGYCGSPASTWIAARYVGGGQYADMWIAAKYIQGIASVRQATPNRFRYSQRLLEWIAAPYLAVCGSFPSMWITALNKSIANIGLNGFASLRYGHWSASAGVDHGPVCGSRRPVDLSRTYRKIALNGFASLQVQPENGYCAQRTRARHPDSTIDSVRWTSALRLGYTPMSALHTVRCT